MRSNREFREGRTLHRQPNKENEGEDIAGNRDTPEQSPSIDRETLEANVPGAYMAGSVTAGRATSTVLIENGRFDGEKIFAD
jgi:hypothetical protein